MTQDGETTGVALSIFSADFEAVDRWSTPAPEVPTPEEVEMLSFPGGRVPPIFEQIETRPTFGPPIFSGGEEPLTGGWTRAAHPCRTDAELLALYADIWWPAPFVRLTPETIAAAPTLDLTIHFRDEPPRGDRDQILGRFSSSTLVRGIWEEDGALWSEDGRLLVQSRQLALLRSFPPPA